MRAKLTIISAIAVLAIASLAAASVSGTIDNTIRGLFYEGPGCTMVTNGMLISGPTVRLCNNPFGITYNLPSGITLNSENTRLDCDGALLQGSGSGNGITLKGSHTTIHNCRIKGYDRAIFATNSQENSIFDNQIEQNKAGIVLNGLTNSFSMANEIVRNGLGSNEVAIMLLSSSSNTIAGNTFTGNGLGILFAAGEEGFSADNKVYGNTFTGGAIKGMAYSNTTSFQLTNDTYFTSINTFCYNGLGNTFDTPESQYGCQQAGEGCINECSAGSAVCSQAGRMECGQFDQDTCVEWSEPIACPQGTACVSGACQQASSSGVGQACIPAGQSCAAQGSTCCSGTCKAQQSCEQKSCRTAFGNNKDACLSHAGCGWYELNSLTSSYCTGKFNDCKETGRTCEP